MHDAIPPTSQKVRVDLADRSYDIHIGRDLLRDAEALLARVIGTGPLLLLHDSNVAAPWAQILFASLQPLQRPVHLISIPAGEASKSAEALSHLWERMAEARVTRDSTVLALGGGMVGDLAGFAAASMLRGLRFVQLPTTLLAMVDSSVGGKTGINLPQGKNLVGAFHQPELVIADLDTLSTLSAAEVSSGLAEVIKYGVIADAEFFAFLEQHIEGLATLRDDQALIHAIRRSVEIKAWVVGQDEREDGLRRILNFGHTLGHAVEAEAGYSGLRHGEAIAIGMVAASQLTLNLGFGEWSEADHSRLLRVIERADLPTGIPAAMSADALFRRTLVDKKAVQGRVRYVLPTRMGAVETVSDIPADAVQAVIEQTREGRHR